MPTDLTIPTATAELDQDRVAAFAERLFDTFTAGMVTLMIDLAHRTGLFDALAGTPATSPELAARARLDERYVRECLGALVTAGIVDHDPATSTYALPPEHAVSLTGTNSLNLAPLSQVTGLLGRHVPAVESAFRAGGGVPYEVFRPEFTDVMDGMSRGFFDSQLVDGVLPLAHGVTERLAAGARAADIGCGTGHSTNVLARAFPASTFVGYDLAGDALARGRAEAAEMGLSNVSFEQCDLVRLDRRDDLDIVVAFDAIHDQVDPAGVLDRVHAALVPGGTFLMFDIKASSHLERNVGNPLAPWLYAVSTLHCMTVSLAHGGAGLGTVWGEELARSMLADAGFVDISVHDVPDDPIDSLFVAHRSR